MRLACSSPRLIFAISLTLIAATAAIFTTGCGSGSMSKTPPLTGNTQVTMVLTSTANDQLAAFDLVLQSISLTGQSGKTVSLLSVPQGLEFIHLNGHVDPVATVSIPQDIYTSASASIGGAQFTCVTLTPDGGLYSDTYAYGYTPAPNVTVSLPSPITATGDHMSLSLDLLVSQSANYPSCYIAGGTIPTYSITPTFNLSPATFSSSSANEEAGKVAQLDGQITAIGAAGDTFTLADGFGFPQSLSITTGSDTVYQGVSGFSALAAGTFVDMDSTIQSDGSLLATRIAVEDPSAVQVQIGPLMYSSAAEPALVLWGQQQLGTGVDAIGGQYFSYGSATFQVSGQLTNLQNLPFTPNFSASNMVAGQNVYLTADTLVISRGFPYTPASSVTLIPQTIDGVVTASSTSGGFNDYSVTLAAYDLFPTLAVQQGQATLLSNPNTVEVYVDSNTQMLNSQPIVPGNTLRFYGLVFNDNGTLRMDCAQVSDGVDFTVLPTASQQAHKGSIHTLADSAGSARQTVNVITPPN